MFGGLRSALSGAARRLGEREIREGDVDEALAEMEVSLLEADVALEVVESIKEGIRSSVVGTSAARGEVAERVRGGAAGAIAAVLDRAGEVDLPGMAEAKRDSGGGPFVVLFLGVNGTGKTTTVAKVAHMLRGRGLSVVVAAADTFRAGAIEQLREHAGRLGVKVVAQNYGSDPAAVARDAVAYARAHRVDCVLVDTAGRMQTNANLMAQVGKIAAVVSPDLRVFVGDSLAGNDAVSQAREFHGHAGLDAAILTKADADGGGGSALSIAHATSAPVIYVGTGQGYADLEPFSRDAFLGAVLGGAAA